MIDLAADMAAIFDDPMGFAEDATYTPDGGSAVAVRIIPARPDETINFGDTRIGDDTAQFLLPVSEVADPAAGDSITYDGATYIVQGRPERDERRTFWRIDTRPA